MENDGKDDDGTTATTAHSWAVTDDQAAQLVALDRHCLEPAPLTLAEAAAHLALHGEPIVRNILLAAELTDALTEEALGDLALKGVATRAAVLPLAALRRVNHLLDALIFEVSHQGISLARKVELPSLRVKGLDCT